MMSNYTDFSLLTVLVGIPLLCIGLGLRKIKTCGSPSAKMVLGTGIAILCTYLLVVLAYIVLVGPGRNGIVAKGVSPEGREYCVVQTFKGIVEPYQVSFYIRDAVGVWRWNYLAHQDVAWRSATVDFINGIARVSRNGILFREIPLPTNTVDLATVEPGYRDYYCPSKFTTADIVAFHNRKFK